MPSELLGGARGEYTRVHPNDHVNMGQSTNDVFPTATRLALLMTTPRLVDAARALARIARAKAAEFADVLKVGRTHLQDAVPITLGQEFSGWAACVARGADDVERAATQLLELNLGATALGTGLNAGDDYTTAAVANLARYTGVPVVPAANRFRVTQSMGDVVAWSGAVRRLSVEAGKVASDLRLLSMGPRAGLAEIALPAVQPGSSIMPGKVNPSIPEMVNQVCFQVIGCDATIAAAAEAGQLELNVMMPVIAWNALHACTHPGAGAGGASLPHGRRYRRGPRTLPRAARSQHGNRHGAQPVHRLRGHGGDREGVGADGPSDPRAGARARPARRRRGSMRSWRRNR